MHTEFDPKVILAKQKAKEELARTIKNANENVLTIMRGYRGRVMIMFRNGNMVECIIKLSTGSIMMVDYGNGRSLDSINKSDIVDIEVL